VSFFSFPNATTLFAARERLVVEADSQVWVVRESDVAGALGLRQLLGGRAVALESPVIGWCGSAATGTISWVESSHVNLYDLETGHRRVLLIKEFEGPRPSHRDPKWTGLEYALALPFAPGLIYQRARVVHNLYETNDIVWADATRGTAVGETGISLRDWDEIAVDPQNRALFVLDGWTRTLYRLAGPGEPAVDWFPDGVGKDPYDKRDLLHMAVSPRGGHVAVAHAGPEKGAPARVHLGRSGAPRFESTGSVPCTSYDLELWLRWSPDGRTLAVVEREGRRAVIRLLDPEARLRRSLRVRAAVVDVCWATHGKAIYLSDETGIHVVKV
jgi:hypothetical protein